MMEEAILIIVVVLWAVAATYHLGGWALAHISRSITENRLTKEAKIEIGNLQIKTVSDFGEARLFDLTR